MNKFFSTIVMALLLLPAAAQTRCIEAELASDPMRAYGTDYPYLYKMTALTPAPDGYKAFYISHYGRHGSRYSWTENLYLRMDSLLTMAHNNHILTEAGEKFYSNFQAALPEFTTNWGELSEIGWNQHKQIAKTMYDRFPEVFVDGGHICAISSLAGRCVMSMTSFCMELKGCNPKLDIHELSSRSTLDAVVPADHQNPVKHNFKHDMKPRYEKSSIRLPEDTTLTTRILSRIFTTTTGLPRAPHRIASQLKDFYTLLPDVGKEGMMCGIYTDQDVVSQWEKSNLGTYSWLFNLQYESAPILKDILNKAKDVIEGKSHDVASLRFGHDACLGPLTILMGINGADRDPENPADVKYCYQNWETCMACNAQFIFYRNDTGDTLVKCLLNGSEATLPLPGHAPYYKWTDFLNYYSKKIAEF